MSVRPALPDVPPADRHKPTGSVRRLDCVENNADLRRYYARQGFREVGGRVFDGPWHSAVLWEKSLR